MNLIKPQAPELEVSQWFNTRSPVSLSSLRGRVVVLHAFQILCPGCVMSSLPQAQRIRQSFSENDVAVIGPHSVFERHHAMQAEALAVFLHEYRIRYPVAVDRHDPPDAVPVTMAAYGMQGTPSLVLIDRAGQIRHQHFGVMEDLALGNKIGSILAAQTSDTPIKTNHASCSIAGHCQPTSI